MTGKARASAGSANVAAPAPAAPKLTADEAALDAALERANAKIDMFGPLIWQMWKLNKAEYMAWVHEAFRFDAKRHNGMSEARLFQWDFLEPLSKTVWWVIPLVWLPVAAFCWHWYVRSASFTALGAAGCLGTGLLLWTLVEYAVHRWVFHADDSIPDNGVSILAHFLLHGIHHKVPMDRNRLVMPPVLFGVLASLGYGLFRALFLDTLLSWGPFHAVFGSVLVGYVWYDLTHYSQHHASNLVGHMADMRRYHMKHHFNGQQGVGFGITTKLWDRVFGTVLDVSAPAHIAGHRDAKDVMQAIAGKDE